MAATLLPPMKTSKSDVLKKVLLWCGIFSSLLYVAMNIFVARQWEEYNSVTQTVSELSAIGAPTRSLWVPLGFLYTLLIIAFGWGLLRSVDQNRRLRTMGRLMVAYGIVSLAWPYAPMHQREVLAAGGGSLTDTMHLAMGMISVIFMMSAIGVGAVTFGKRFRLYSIFTMLVLLVFGILTALDAPNVQANLPTPWVGVWERINIGSFLLWVVVLVIILLRKEPNQLITESSNQYTV